MHHKTTHELLSMAKAQHNVMHSMSKHVQVLLSQRGKASHEDAPVA